MDANAKAGTEYEERIIAFCDARIAQIRERLSGQAQAHELAAYEDIIALARAEMRRKARHGPTSASTGPGPTRPPGHGVGSSGHTNAN